MTFLSIHLTSSFVPSSLSPQSLLYLSLMHPFSTHLNKLLSAARAPAMCLELSYKLLILTNNPEVGLYKSHFTNEEAEDKEVELAFHSHQTNQ